MPSRGPTAREAGTISTRLGPTTRLSEGIHSHFFLMGDRRCMYVLVLQAFPAREFEDLEAVFDRIISSFRLV